MPFFPPPSGHFTLSIIFRSSYSGLFIQTALLFLAKYQLDRIFVLIYNMGRNSWDGIHIIVRLNSFNLPFSGL